MNKLLAISIAVCCSVVIGADMMNIEYERHEFHGEPERRHAELSVLVYDIPYFGACGIFPPLHIANQIFRSGGSQGGMSPGATWRPFDVSQAEYEALLHTIERLDPGTLGEQARYTRVKFERDADFDQIPDWESWLMAVCEKHRDNYLRRQGGS
ncbi:MAG: hypothetical protein H6953_08650 [Chromatiaceae bacterium]|nr:hypothetical protein [Chromatiaceae bacterium]MCP5315463.1 hypothetical protein [Chromatiaceae bacterium]